MFICALSRGFFDGASQNGIGGAGGILHIYEDWWYKFVAGIGRAGNNMAEKWEKGDFAYMDYLNCYDFQLENICKPTLRTPS